MFLSSPRTPLKSYLESEEGMFLSSEDLAKVRLRVVATVREDLFQLLVVHHLLATVDMLSFMEEKVQPRQIQLHLQTLQMYVESPRTVTRLTFRSRTFGTCLLAIYQTPSRAPKTKPAGPLS